MLDCERRNFLGLASGAIFAIINPARLDSEITQRGTETARCLAEPITIAVCEPASRRAGIKADRPL